MAWRDLRAFLDALGDDLRRVSDPFSPRFEIAAALREARPDGRRWSSIRWWVTPAGACAAT